MNDFLVRFACFGLGNLAIAIPMAAVAPTEATPAEKLASPPPSSTWSAAKARISPVARSTPMRDRIRNAWRLIPDWNCS